MVQYAQYGSAIFIDFEKVRDSKTLQNVYIRGDLSLLSSLRVNKKECHGGKFRFRGPRRSGWPDLGIYRGRGFYGLIVPGRPFRLYQRGPR